MTVIAYLVLAHKNPKQVHRLLNCIYSPSDLFYINISETKSNRERRIWKNMLGDYETRNVCITFGYNNSYSTFKLVSANLDAMKKFAQLRYDYFIYLSGQCYPLKSNQYIKNFFDGKTLSYINASKISTEWPEVAFRFRYSFYRVPGSDSISRAGGSSLLNKTSLGRRLWAQRGKNLFLRIPRINKRIPYGLEPYGGQAWVCLSRKHVDYVLEFVENKPDLMRFFKHVKCPNEHFFHTIIMNSHFKDDVAKDDLWYIDWDRKREYPAILNMSDAAVLMKSRDLFARKFDITVDEKILDFIDAKKTTSST